MIVENLNVKNVVSSRRRRARRAAFVSICVKDVVCIICGVCCNCFCMFGCNFCVLFNCYCICIIVVLCSRAFIRRTLSVSRKSFSSFSF